jgi:hypothetical protein
MGQLFGSDAQSRCDCTVSYQGQGTLRRLFFLLYLPRLGIQTQATIAVGRLDSGRYDARDTTRWLFHHGGYQSD